MKIAILAAMSKEMELLRNILKDEKNECVDKLKVYTGKIGNHEIILAQCGIGKVNAALNTYKVIREFNPDLVINSGVAGGAGGVRVGELLVANGVAYYDVWCGPGTVPGTADGFENIFRPSSNVIATAKENLPADGVAYGLIATGDVFVSKAEEVARIKEVHPDAVAVDMESAAIAQTCVSENVPFSIIRVVSDTPGEAENLSQYKNFWTEAPEKTFHALETIISHLA